MKTPSERLAALAADHAPGEDDILMLRCQECGAARAWVEWVDFNSRCPDCGADRAEIAEPKG
jgi:predicted Zn-ribbon and HTH transcriptional regulator